MRHRGWDYVDHMVQTCEEIFEYMQNVTTYEEFEANGMVKRAVTMCLLDLGELFKSLTNEEKELYPSDSWQNIIGFRNRASHGYRRLNFEIIFRIVTNQVPPLYGFLKNKQQEQKKNDVRP